MRPIVPNDVEERFGIPNQVPAESGKLVYRPSLLANVSCHYVRTSAGLDDWLDRCLLYPVAPKLTTDVWSEALELAPGALEVALRPEEGFTFAELPPDMLNDKKYKAWSKDLRDHLYRRVPVTLYECKELKAFSEPGQDEIEARLAWKQKVRERRDEEKEELQAKYAKKVKALESKIRSAQQRLEREQAQYDQQRWSSMLSIGQTVLGALLGNKISSRGATAGRSIGRAAQQRTDVVHAQETIEDLEREKRELENECEVEVRELQGKFSIDALTLEPLQVRCRKGDLKVQLLALLWVPWEVDPNGIANPLVELPARSSA